MAQGRQWHTLHDTEKKRRRLCSSAIDSAPLLPMSHLPALYNEALSNPKPHTSTSPHLLHSLNFLLLPPNGQQVHMRNIKSHEILASRISPSAHVCNARNGEHKPTQLPATARIPDVSSVTPQKREQWWVSDMDEYLTASRLCREEAMACLLQAAGVHWPFAERENRKKIKHKSLLLTCRALNAGTNKSWRGLKKLFSKQFMPFSNRDHRGLHHINTTISKRSLKTLNVGGRKMDARIQLGANKSDYVLGHEKPQGKENTEQNDNAIRECSSNGVEICRSRLGSCCEKDCKLQQGKLKEGGFKKKVYILLNKASGVALEVCDILNLE